MKKILCVFAGILCVFMFTGCADLFAALTGQVVVTFDLDGGHINGRVNPVEVIGDPGEEYDLPQEPFKNADYRYRYVFLRWEAASVKTSDYDCKRNYYSVSDQVGVFPEENVVYTAIYERIAHE